MYSFCLHGNQLTGCTWSSRVINFLCAGMVCCFSRPAKKKQDDLSLKQNKLKSHVEELDFGVCSNFTLAVGFTFEQQNERPDSEFCWACFSERSIISAIFVGSKGFFPPAWISSAKSIPIHGYISAQCASPKMRKGNVRDLFTKYPKTGYL